MVKNGKKGCLWTKCGREYGFFLTNYEPLADEAESQLV